MAEKLNISDSLSINISNSCSTSIDESTTTIPGTSSSMLKLNVDSPSDVSKMEVNDSDNTIKSPLLIHKPKSSNFQKPKTKFREKLNINDSLSINISNSCSIDESTTTIPGTSSSMLKLNVDSPSDISKMEVNDSDNTIKSPLLIHKPKSSNFQKPKTKFREKLNINDSLFVNIDACDVENSTTNFPERQNCDAELITNSSPVTITFVPESDNNLVASENNEVETQSLNLFQFAKLVTTFTSPSTSTSLTSTTTTSTALPSTYASSPTPLTELPLPESEISYGISLLSEAIGQHCNESVNNSAETMSVQQNSSETESPSKKFKKNN